MSHYENALEEITNARGAIEHLDNLHAIPRESRPLNLVGKANAELGHALAMARIQGLLEIAQQLETLNALLATSARPLGVSRLTGGRA